MPRERLFVGQALLDHGILEKRREKKRKSTEAHMRVTVSYGTIHGVDPWPASSNTRAGPMFLGGPARVEPGSRAPRCQCHGPGLTGSRALKIDRPGRPDPGRGPTPGRAVSIGP